MAKDLKGLGLKCLLQGATVSRAAQPQVAFAWIELSHTQAIPSRVPHPVEIYETIGELAPIWNQKSLICLADMGIISKM